MQSAPAASLTRSVSFTTAEWRSITMKINHAVGRKFFSWFFACGKLNTHSSPGTFCGTQSTGSAGLTLDTISVSLANEACSLSKRGHQSQHYHTETKASGLGLNMYCTCYVTFLVELLKSDFPLKVHLHFIAQLSLWTFILSLLHLPFPPTCSYDKETRLWEGLKQIDIKFCILNHISKHM